MRFVSTFLVVSALLASAPEAGGAEFCEQQQLVLDTPFEWDFQSGFAYTLILPSRRAGELAPTKARLQLGNGGTDELFAILDFPRKPNEVGLPYNVYRLQLQIGGDEEADRQLIDNDFTEACTGPGLTLWPGSRIELPALRLTPHADGSPRALEKVRLRFWGR